VYRVWDAVQEKKKSLSRGQGLGFLNCRLAAHFPPPFCEVVEKDGSQAVDLTQGSAAEHVAHIGAVSPTQLRDSTGLSPVSP
jgi:hypothetical protein